MTVQEVKRTILQLAGEYNRECFFENDPLLFPKHFARLMKGENGLFPAGCNMPPVLQDVEIAGILAAHLAWGRRDMIVRNCIRMLDEMHWEPYRYVMDGRYRNGDESLHRTIKWNDFAVICANLQAYYRHHPSLETLTPDEIRIQIFGQKNRPGTANKKIHLFRRWMVRSDGPVDLGIWKNTPPSSLIIPLDVHVHRSALQMGITRRKGMDYTTALEITRFLKKIFPQDPCMGDFALFAYAASQKNENPQNNQ